ncbi:MAG: IclR family transcriptional regulator [Sphingobium sp.]
MLAASAPPTVKSAMRTLDIIEYVVAHPSGVIAQDIAGALTIPVSSLSYLLGTLVERDYLTREGRRYLPGPGLDRLRAAPQDRSLADRVEPLTRSLRTRLNETVSFFIQAGWEMEAIVTETAEQSLRYSIAVGTRTPMHCLAAGKAMLAALPEEEIDAYFASSTRDSFTPQTRFDEGVLRAEIAKIRITGIAHTNEEYTPGIHGIGKAVVVDGVPVGAFAVAIPVPRLTDDLEERTVALLTETVALFGEAQRSS